MAKGLFQNVSWNQAMWTVFSEQVGLSWRWLNVPTEEYIWEKKCGYSCPLITYSDIFKAEDPQYLEGREFCCVRAQSFCPVDFLHWHSVEGNSFPMGDPQGVKDPLPAKGHCYSSQPHPSGQSSQSGVLESRAPQKCLRALLKSGIAVTTVLESFKEPRQTYVSSSTQDVPYFFQMSSTETQILFLKHRSTHLLWMSLEANVFSSWRKKIDHDFGTVILTLE